MNMMLLSLVYAFVSYTLRCAAQNVASFTRYDSTSCVDFDGQPGFPTPTVQDCLAFSTANPQTNGVVYQDSNNVCKVMTNTNNSILIKLHTNTGWTTYVKDTSANFQLVFKTDAPVPGFTNTLSNMWIGTGGGYTTVYSPQVASLNASASCACVYRNPFIDNFSASQV